MSSVRLIILTAAASLIASVAVAKSPTITAEHVDLPAGSALEVTVKVGELAICDGSPCYLWLGGSYKDDDKLLFLRIDHEGTWTLTGPNEHYSKKHKDENDNVALCSEHTEETKTAAEEKKDKKEEKEEPAEDATPDDSWKDKPVLSVEERRARQFDRGVSKQFCVAAANGTLAGEGDERILSIPGDVLPEGDFYVWSNGHFGAYLGGVQIGTPSMTGGVEVER